MRVIRFLVVGLFLSLAFVLTQPQSAFASFHCMRIHGVMAGFNNNPKVQYVELRMNLGGQNLVAGHQVKFYDSAGTLKATFTFPNSITNGLNGESILIGTAEFNTQTVGGDADFIFSAANTTGMNGGDPLHPVQSPGGRIEFAPGFDNCDADLTASPGEVDTVGYGGGSTSYGSSAVALPNPSDLRALRLSNLNVEATDNSAEYSLQPVATSTFSVSTGNLPTDFTTPRNNGRTVLQLVGPVGGIAEPPDVARTPLEANGASSGSNVWLVVGIAAAASAAAVAAGGAVWYARRRRYD